VVEHQELALSGYPPSGYPQDAPDDDQNGVLLESESQDPGGFLFTRALRGALGHVALWSMTWFALWLLSVVVALPWYERLGAAMKGRYEAGAQVHDLDTIFLADHRELLGGLKSDTSLVGAMLVLIATLLVGVFAAGGWLQVLLDQGHGHSLRRFFFGGARYFWRFLRVL
jgi:hypothetical protein